MKSTQQAIAQPLSDYIVENYGTQAAFAAHIGTFRSEVNRWVKKGFIVVGGRLYSPRRVISDR